MDNIKLIFDKRTLDTLIRLGVPDSALLELLKTGVAPKTEDDLINDYLKSVLVVKKFKNTWGGKRDGSGKKQINSNTSSFHLEKQLDYQVVDKDKDKDKKEYISLEDKRGKGGKRNLSFTPEFIQFWSVYPKQRAGNKQKAFSAYKRAIKDGRATAEQINRVAEIYSVSDEVKRGYAKGAEAWLNDDRFNIDYSKTGKAEDGMTDFQREVLESMNW